MYKQESGSEAENGLDLRHFDTGQGLPSNGLTHYTTLSTSKAIFLKQPCIMCLSRKLKYAVNSKQMLTWKGKAGILLFPLYRLLQIPNCLKLPFKDLTMLGNKGGKDNAVKEHMNLAVNKTVYFKNKIKKKTFPCPLNWYTPTRSTLIYCC